MWVFCRTLCDMASSVAARLLLLKHFQAGKKKNASIRIEKKPVAIYVSYGLVTGRVSREEVFIEFLSNG